MKENYIKILSESFATKVNAEGWVEEKIIPTDLQEHFRYALNELREFSPELHTQIRKMNKFAQQKIFDQYFTQLHFEEMYGNFDFDLDDDQLNELYDILIDQDLNLMESGFEEFIKKNQKQILNFVKQAKTEGKPEAKRIANNIKKSAAGSAAAATVGLTTHGFFGTIGLTLGKTIGTVLSAPFTAIGAIAKHGFIPSMGIGVCILAILILGAKPISKMAFKSLYYFGVFLQKVQDTLSKMHPAFRLTYIIIQKNSSECYDTCNIDPNDATYTNYLYNYKAIRDLATITMSEDKIQQVKCLRQCYLYSVKESIKLQANVYFNCLKSTGDLSKLPMERDLTMYQRVLKDSKLSNSCDPFRITLMETFNKFDELINLLFSVNDVSKRQEHRTELMNSIYKLQQENQRTNSYTYKPQMPPRDGKFYTKPKDTSDYKKDKYR